MSMAFVSWTSVDTWVFTRLLGIRGEVLQFAGEALRIMCALPVVVGFRNYFHGIALAGLKTEGMAFGAVLRVLAIYLAARPPMAQAF